MKYIRTKDGRIVKVEEHMMIKETTIDGVQKCFRLVYKDRPFTCVLRGAEDYIIKQSDTIEELCDEFVIIRKDDIQTGGDLKTFKEMKLRRGCDIEYEVEDDYFYYGAIWTDKGLIYIAKMNEKGELELL